MCGPKEYNQKFFAKMVCLHGKTPLKTRHRQFLKGGGSKNPTAIGFLKNPPTLAAKMEAQVEEIKGCWMELERMNLKGHEDVRELLTAASEDFLQEERVTQCMRLCLGVLKKWIEKLQVGKPLRRPLDHAGGSSAGGSPPKDHILANPVWGVLCTSHTAYMTRYAALTGKEPKQRFSYASLDEATGALHNDLHWKNAHFREMGGVLGTPRQAAGSLWSVPPLPTAGVASACTGHQTNMKVGRMHLVVL